MTNEKFKQLKSLLIVLIDEHEWSYAEKCVEALRLWSDGQSVPKSTLLFLDELYSEYIND